MTRTCALLVLFLLQARPADGQTSTAAVVREADLRSAGYKSYERANTLYVARRLPESLAAIEDALRLDPKLVPALTLKAKMAMTMNRYDVAQESLERALATDPTSQYAQFLYGFQFYLANDLERAVPQLKKARQLNPADSRAALYLGLASESLGQTGEAISLYQDAMRLEQTAGTPQAGTFLVGARLLLLMGRLEDAERWIRDALNAEPNSRDCHYEFARLLLRKGDVVRASEEGEAALLLPNGETKDTQIHYLLIRAYGADRPAAAARHAEALRLAEKTAVSTPP